jgi:putative tricarboxylic transport membrane protein
MRRYEMATAAAVVAVAALAMFDSRGSALIDTSGKYPGGIGPGFYPFWAAAFMGGAALIVLYRAAVSQTAGVGVFANRDSVVSVMKLVGPLLLATAALYWLGFYVVSCLYMAFFGRYIGKYRWAWVALIALAVPVVVYVAFEYGFRVRLPKSELYELGFPI